jgi:hypothetical protein
MLTLVKRLFLAGKPAKSDHFANVVAALSHEGKENTRRSDLLRADRLTLVGS